MKEPQKKRFSWHNRYKSFHFAAMGLKTAFTKEHNMWLHLCAALLVILLGCFFAIRPTEWLIIWICIGMVISMEIVNTAIEKLCDLVHPEIHPQIKQVKDLAAAAVLVVAIISLIVGLWIFLPYIIG